jgi:hypothetical protein
MRFPQSMESISWTGHIFQLSDQESPEHLLAFLRLGQVGPLLELAAETRVGLWNRHVKWVIP